MAAQSAEAQQQQKSLLARLRRPSEGLSTRPRPGVAYDLKRLEASGWAFREIFDGVKVDVSVVFMSFFMVFFMVFGWFCRVFDRFEASKRLSGAFSCLGGVVQAHRHEPQRADYGSEAAHRDVAVSGHQRSPRCARYLRGFRSLRSWKGRSQGLQP